MLRLLGFHATPPTGSGTVHHALLVKAACSASPPYNRCHITPEGKLCNILLASHVELTGSCLEQLLG